MELALAILLLAFSAFFSGSETAFTSLTLIDQKVLENKKGSRAKTALYFCKHPDLLITTVLIGNDLVNVALSALVTKMTIEKFGNPYVGATTGILTLILLVFGEVSPKQIAMYRNLPIALAVAIPLRALSILLFPVIWLFSRLTLLIHLVFGPSGRGKLTEDGLRHVTDAAEDAGVVDEYENDLMQRAIHFSETQVKAIMTHRTDVTSIWIGDDQETILDTIKESGLSRFPVYNDDIDDIIGILSTRQYLLNMSESKPKSLKSLLRDAYFVPETVPAEVLLRNMQHVKTHIAIVVDEYGGMSGIVTMEDLLEEIVGNIYDEFDPAAETEIQPLGGDTWRISGSADLEAVSEELNVTLPQDEDYDTLGGLIFSRFRSIPEDGSTPSLTLYATEDGEAPEEGSADTLEIQVETIEDRRIEWARVHVIRAERENEDAEAED